MSTVLYIHKSTKHEVFDMDVKEIKNDLIVLPLTIKEGSIELYYDVKKRIELEKKIEGKKLAHQSNIGSEKDENGKLKYSNELRRKTELEVRLHEDKEYCELCDEYEELKEKISLKEINLKFWRDRFNAARALTKVMGD